ncbi:hypothetical protein NST12_16495 [Bacillus sp. FSL W8-1127]|uniref:hypothetical protein n=1 Tax=Bacillus sp. FSL W8-1127 TaxID=2954710 RepID=UPI0030F75D2F
MRKFCFLEGIDNNELVLVSQGNEIRVPATESQVNLFSNLLDQGEPVLLKVDTETLELIDFDENEFRGELENPALLGATDELEEEEE